MFIIFYLFFRKSKVIKLCFLFKIQVELLRTQTEFDDSLTLKIYLLQFVNYYASIFYIAFFKGKFVGYPGQYVRFLKFRQEECGPGGCLMELCMQLSIIMVGKQAMTTVLEMLLPLFYKWLNTLKVQVGTKKSKNKRESTHRKAVQWVRDFKLVEWGPRSLFPEYLEMGEFSKNNKFLEELTFHCSCQLFVFMIPDRYYCFYSILNKKFIN